MNEDPAAIGSVELGQDEPGAKGGMVSGEDLEARSTQDQQRGGERVGGGGVRQGNGGEYRALDRFTGAWVQDVAVAPVAGLEGFAGDGGDAEGSVGESELDKEI